MDRAHYLPCKVCNEPVAIPDKVVRFILESRKSGLPDAKITATTCRRCVALRDLDDGEVVE